MCIRDRSIPGPGQRHIENTELVSKSILILFVMKLLELWEQRTKLLIHIRIYLQEISGLSIPFADGLIIATAQQSGVELRKHDNVELETLGFVYRHHLNNSG